jgi:hypothetical protein
LHKGIRYILSAVFHHLIKMSMHDAAIIKLDLVVGCTLDLYYDPWQPPAFSSKVGDQHTVTYLESSHPPSLSTILLFSLHSILQAWPQQAQCRAYTPAQQQLRR